MWVVFTLHPIPQGKIHIIEEWEGHEERDKYKKREEVKDAAV